MGHIPKKTKLKVNRTGHLGNYKVSSKLTQKEKEIKDLENRIAELDETLSSGMLSKKELRDGDKLLNKLEDKLMTLKGEN